ncbi:MAG: hypothetical protein AAB345_04365, partial [Patescibacteria group bacterium]
HSFIFRSKKVRANAKITPQIMFSLAPQFFDIFGSIGFIYIVVLALLMVRGVFIPKWASGLLLLVGSIGLIVDGLMVYTYYLR